MINKPPGSKGSNRIKTLFKSLPIFLCLIIVLSSPTGQLQFVQWHLINANKHKLHDTVWECRLKTVALVDYMHMRKSRNWFYIKPIDESVKMHKYFTNTLESLPRLAHATRNLAKCQKLVLERLSEKMHMKEIFGKFFQICFSHSTVRHPNQNSNSPILT